MKNSLLLLLFFSISIASVGQNCEANLGFVVTATREKMITFKEAIEAKSERTKTLSFFGGVQEKTVILAMTLTQEYKSPCVSNGGKVVFLFDDETELKLKNGFDTNCGGTVAVYFSEKNGNLAELNQLLTKTLSAVKMTFRDAVRKVDVTKEEAKRISENLKCVYDHINDTPVYLAHESPQPSQSSAADSPVEVGSDSSKVFLVVETQPQYEGGWEAMMNFIRKNLQYPLVAKRNGYQGTVYVSFVVQRDGTVADAKVIRGIHESLDKEAIRVVNLMPKWKPGMQNGKTVHVRFNLPIKFGLGGALVVKKRQIN
jgi:TonB family protein